MPRPESEAMAKPAAKRASGRKADAETERAARASLRKNRDALDRLAKL